MVGRQRHYKTHQKAFTLVELLIVIAVIGILAAITIVGYGAWKKNTAINVIKSDLNGAVAAMEDARNWGSTYPTTVPVSFKPSPDDTMSGGSSDGKTFCVTATSVSNPSVVYYVTNTSTTPQAGSCPIIDGAMIQTVTSANCPTTVVRAVDARDNHSYWVQKQNDGRCWMLTNLAYAGGGTNTYGDVDTLTNGTGGAVSYTSANYYIPTTGSNVTTDPTAPSTSTDGGATNPQYGYLYNWCGAMGAQTGTSACANATTPLPNASTSVCPAGWRLPTGNGGEFGVLNTFDNGGLTNTDAGLRNPWLGQRSGYWYTGFYNQGNAGSYWSSTQYSATDAYDLAFLSSAVYTVDNYNKAAGFAVRCIAN